MARLAAADGKNRVCSTLSTQALAYGELIAAFQFTSSPSFLSLATPRKMEPHEEDPFLAGWASWMDQALPKFTHLVPKELVPLIVEFSFHVGFY